MLDKYILIRETESVKDALKKLDKSAKKVLLVVNGRNQLLGTITDGDIRRYILSGKSLENDIKEVYNKKSVFITKGDFSIDLARELLIKNKIELLPIVDKENKIIDFATWDQVFSERKADVYEVSKINIPVVIMAGGKGARLEPFTTVLPKPLIPIGDKPIIEIIMDEFKKWGTTEYYVTLNHKGDMIEAYFKNIEKDYRIKYIREKTFLGTAGSLKLLKGKISGDFIVSNCDVIVKANFAEVVDFHKKQGAALTILSSIQHYEIPYGVIKSKEEGEVVDIIERPEYTFTINAGVYILAKECLEHIPEKTPFAMTDLIKSLIKNNKKVAMYPVNENDYIDIGQWEEYKKAIEKLQLFK